LVVGRRFFALPPRGADDLPADERFAPARALRLGGAFFRVVFAPDVAAAPDATRLECLTRWRTVFFGAASAMDAALKATSSATSSHLT
jgi:hypothetical protein